MKSNLLFIFKMLKNEKKKSNKIIFYLKLYIIGRDQIISKFILNSSQVLKNFSNSP